MNNKNETRAEKNRVHKAWKRLEPLLEGAKIESPVLLSKRWMSYRVAATIVLIALAGAIIYYHLNTFSYKNDNATPMLVVLPDSSTVVLKSQARVTFNNSFAGLSPRKVSLKGDGFFSVKHTVDHTPFLIDLENGHQIEVLGTSFNIQQKGVENEIVLTEGRIKVRLKNNESIYMQPGDLITTKTDGKVVHEKGINATLYMTWMSENIYFENLQLGDLLKWLNRTYGLRFHAPSETLQKREITGKIPINDPEILVEGLEEMFQIKLTPISRTND